MNTLPNTLKKETDLSLFSEKPGTCSFTNPLPFSEKTANILFLVWFSFYFAVYYILSIFTIRHFEGTSRLVFLILLFIIPIFCFGLILWLVVRIKGWRWPLRMLENLVSSVEVNARQFRVQKTNGAVLPFAFDICTPSILVFRDRKKHFYCLKVAYPEHGPDYFLLGTVQKEAEKLRRALCLTSFVEETPVSNAIGSWAALPVKSDQPEAEHPFGKTFVSESSSLKKKAGRRVVPEISCKCPAPAGETLIFSLPWVEEEVTGLTLPMKILVSLALGLVIAVIVTEILSGASLIISGVICLLLAGGISWVWTKRTTVCAFYAGLAGLYVAYDDGRLVLYAYASCRFLKYWNTHGELTSLFLQVFSDQERKSIFDQLFDGKEKELDELLHALVIGSERGRQRHGGN